MTRRTPGFNGGSYVIDEIDLDAVAATLSFQNIPDVYRHLELVLLGRTDYAGATSDIINMELNADTTAANYDSESVFGSTNSAGAGQSLLNKRITQLPSSTAPANHGGNSIISIGHYARTDFFKTAFCQRTLWRARTTGNIIIGNEMLCWANAAAISQIDLKSNSGSNFVAGTICTLYGII